MADIESRIERIRVDGDAPHNVFGQYESSQSFLDNFKSKFQCNVLELSDEKMTFEMIGIDASIANAFRRILLAEVPTVAIEDVYIMQNSSVLQDEVLAHRLGLIPIDVDPNDIDFKGEGEDSTDRNTVVFNLQVQCTGSVEGGMENDQVHSSQLNWVPQGDQAARFADRPIKPVHSDILIAKMRPGQTMMLEAHCRKGVGQDHAKFSPVATASYRLLPEVILKKKLKGELAQELVDKCPMGVFDIEDLGGEKAVRVARPRDCTMCRECIREPEWAERVLLQRVPEHFLFFVESVGVMAPEAILQKAIEVLAQKCRSALTELASITAAEGGSAASTGDSM